MVDVDGVGSDDVDDEPINPACCRNLWTASFVTYRAVADGLIVGDLLLMWVNDEAALARMKRAITAIEDDAITWEVIVERSLKEGRVGLGLFSTYRGVVWQVSGFDLSDET